MLGTIGFATPQGCRDQAIILTLLDTALRLSELLGITLDDLRLEEGPIKIMGKGSKERIVPIGKWVQLVLWHYTSRYRPEPEQSRCKLLFLTCDGLPLKKERIEKIMDGRCQKAGIVGVRCSPHTLRHTAAISFLRNRGNVFNLQRLLGQNSLDIVSVYVNLAGEPHVATYYTFLCYMLYKVIQKRSVRFVVINMISKVSSKTCYQNENSGKPVAMTFLLQRLTKMHY